MIIIDKNLEHLASQYSICDKTLIDEFSIKIQLGHIYYEPKTEVSARVVYGSFPEPATMFSSKKRN